MAPYVLMVVPMATRLTAVATLSTEWGIPTPVAQREWRPGLLPVLACPPSRSRVKRVRQRRQTVSSPIWLAASNRWQIRLQTHGQRHVEYFSFKQYGTKSNALYAAKRRLLELAQRDLRGLPLPPGALTFDQVCELWLDEHRHVQNPDEYRNRLRHIRDHLGALTVASLTPADVSLCISALQKQLAPKTMKHVFSCFKSVLNLAQDRGYVARNVAAKFTIRADPRPYDLFTNDELARLVAHVRGTWLELAVRMLVDTGMRPGELCALSWDDLSGESVHIRRSRKTLTQTKTEAGARWVAVSSHTASLIASTFRQSSSPWLFPSHTDQNQPLCLQSFERAWTRALRRAQIRHRRAYDLRHTTLSVAMSGVGATPTGQRINPADVSKFAGHKRPETTVAMYMHALGSADAVAEVLSIARPLGQEAGSGPSTA